MTYTIQDLRNLLRDTGSPSVFSDAQLEVYRSAFPDSILRAASLAVKSWAIEASAVGKSVSTDDLSINLTSRGKDLLAVAQSFLDEAEAGDAAEANDFFQIVPFAGRAGRACSTRPEATPWPNC